MSTLRLTTISNQSGSSSVPSDTVISGSAKAWVNFNGTGTVAIRASFNVSSITDGGVGTYTVNMTTATADANYSVCGTAATPGSSYGVLTPYNGSNVQTTTAIPISTLTASASVYDHTYISVAIFR